MPIPKPAILQGMQPTQDLQEFYQDRTWLGLDLYHAPQDLAEGFVTQADNLYNVGGALMIRPGKQAQLANPMMDASGVATPVYIVGTFQGGGASAVASLSSSGGHITGITIPAGCCGFGYNDANPPTVILSDSTGTGATATAAVSGGQVTAVDVTNAGSNYSAPVVQFATPAIWIVFTAGGKLFKLQNGANTPIEIKYADSSSLSLNSPGVQMSRYGQFAYLIDGSSDGMLIRTDLDSADTVTALNAPTGVPAATAISQAALTGFDPNTATYDAPPSYGSAFQSAVATAALGAGGSIGTITVIHPGLYPSGAAVAASILDVNGSGAQLEVLLSGSGVSSVSTVSGHAGEGYTNPVIVFTVPVGTGTNAFPNSCFAFRNSNWTGYTPNVGQQQTALWTSNVNVFGGGSYTDGTMSQLVRAAPAGANGTANYNADASGENIEWASFYGPGVSLKPTNSIGNIQHLDGSGEWASQFEIGFYYFQCNPNSAITVSVTATTAQNRTSSKTLNFHPTTLTSQTVTQYPAGSLLFDFSELQSDSDHIIKWDVKFVGAPLTGQILGSYEGLCLAYITGGPTWGNLQTSPGSYATGTYTTQRYGQAATAGGWIADSQDDDQLPTVPFNNLTKDARLTVTYGSGANFTPTVGVGGAITGINGTLTGGSGYLQGTVISFVDQGGTGTGASATATVINGQVTGMTNLVGGSGYVTPIPVFGQPFTNIEFISIPLKGFGQSGTSLFSYPGQSIELRLLPAGPSQDYVQVPLTIDSTGSFASGDLTTISPSTLACIAVAQIHFIDNPVVSANPFTFNIGPLTFSGNLAVGFAAYNWVYTEVNTKALVPGGDLTLVQIIESDPSTYSNTLTPTGEFATAQLLLPDQPSNPSSDKWFLYRAGGTFSDGIMRLVTAGDWGPPNNSWTMGNQPTLNSDTPTNDAPPGVQLTPNNPYVSWGQNDQNNNPPPTGMTFLVDNTPDANLVGNPTLVVGKTPAPVGATAIARFANRLWLASGSGVISSWLLSDSTGAGLYFNPTLDPSDPNATIKGSGYIPVGQGDNDLVVALNTLGNVLTVWKGQSSYAVEGSDPTNFSCLEYQAFEGQGLVAPRAITVADNLTYVMQQDGVYTFDGSQFTKISDPIDSLLTPVLNENGGQIAASVAANCAMAFHGGRLLVFAPGVGDNTNTQCFLWDTRFQAWVGRWTGMNIASAVSIGSNVDDPDIWLGGFDGQLYRLSGNGDTLSLGGVSTVNVTNGGNGYASAPTVSFSGGGGTGAAGTAVLGAGSVISVEITNPGSGYTSAPTVSFSGGEGSGVGATADLVAPVTFGLATRAYGRPPEGLSVWMQGRYNLPLGIEDRAWEPFFRRARPTRLWVELNSYSYNLLTDTLSNQPISATAGTLYADTGGTASYPLTISGWQRVPVKTKADRGGLGVIVTVSGQTPYNLKIYAAGVTIARGARVD